MRFISYMRFIICMLMFDCHSLRSLRNFAFRKSAYQSSTVNSIFNWTADKAVDGYVGRQNPEISRTCRKTGIIMGNHTWEVDIGFMIVVNLVMIYGRTDGLDELSGVIVFVGNHSNSWNTNKPLKGTHLSEFQYQGIADSNLAQFVSVPRQNEKTMTLCEVMVFGECSDGMYSEFCNRTYGQCSNGDPCNRDTGECFRGCEPGWTGTLCDKVLRNFALNKSAYQSSTLYFRAFNWTADKAVDGNTDGRYPGTSRTCSKTEKGIRNQSWEVDIGFLLIVNHVVIYDRSDGMDELSGFQVCIGNHSNQRNTSKPLLKKQLSQFRYRCIADNFVARFVSVIRPGKRTISLCEVEVYGECLDGMYSEFCNRTCGQCTNREPCDKDTGECHSGCEPGWTGVLCDKECAKGTYGSECMFTCGQCLTGNETCSATDGLCSMGCREGWQGDTCKNNSSAKLTQTLSRADLTVIGGSVAGACVGAIIIIIIIIAVLKRGRNTDTGGTEMEMNETGVNREESFGYTVVEEIMSPSDYSVASSCIPTTTASRDGSEHAVAQITEAKYEKFQDRGQIESFIYSIINDTETEETNDVGLNIKQE